MTAAATPATVADTLVELIRLAQEEGLVAAGEVWTDLDGVKPSVARARQRHGSPVHVYIGDGDPDHPLVLTVERLGWGQ